MGADEEAEFAALAERQWRFACRVAWAVLRNAHDAEDAAQEAFLRILKARAWRGLSETNARLWRELCGGRRWTGQGNSRFGPMRRGGSGRAIPEAERPWTMSRMQPRDRKKRQ